MPTLLTEKFGWNRTPTTSRGRYGPPCDKLSTLFVLAQKYKNVQYPSWKKSDNTARNVPMSIYIFGEYSYSSAKTHKKGRHKKMGPPDSDRQTVRPLKQGGVSHTNAEPWRHPAPRRPACGCSSPDPAAASSPASRVHSGANELPTKAKVGDSKAPPSPLYEKVIYYLSYMLRLVLEGENDQNFK